MSNIKDLFKDIDEHLMKDDKPSVYLDNAFKNNKFNQYPFTMLSDLSKIEQNIKYHPEGNVWNHVLMVVDEAASRRNQSRDSRALMWSSLLHDTGKGPTTKIRNGRVTSYNHERVGKKMAREFLSHFTEDKAFIDKVAKMVRWHMEALFVTKGLPFANVEEMLKDVPLEEISLLNLSDRLGRGEMSKEKAEDEEKGIKIFLEKCRKIQEKNHMVVK
jgi:tRNA nucleotidyltransferase (CCA-adding enzyme)